VQRAHIITTIIKMTTDVTPPGVCRRHPLLVTVGRAEAAWVTTTEASDHGEVGRLFPRVQSLLPPEKPAQDPCRTPRVYRGRLVSPEDTREFAIKLKNIW